MRTPPTPFQNASLRSATTNSTFLLQHVRLPNCNLRVLKNIGALDERAAAGTSRGSIAIPAADMRCSSTQSSP